MAQVIVVGAGISGLACARELLAAGLSVAVRERAATVGGRMSSPQISGRPVDTGAAYFTARDPAFVHLADQWCERGLARRWTDRFSTLSPGGLGPPQEGSWRYATPGGLRSLVADLAATLPRDTTPVARNSPVSEVTPGPAADGTPADAVALAMPDPQARRILDPRLRETHRQVAGRRWEPALTLTARYPQRSWPDFGGAFVSGDPVLSWIADDGSRRGDGAPVLVAHSTAAFAASRLGDPATVAAEMTAHIDRLLGCGAPAATRTHRWSYARPAMPREERFFFSAEGVGLAGDGWGPPRIETAWLSGRALGRHIAQRLGTP